MRYKLLATAFAASFVFAAVPASAATTITLTGNTGVSGTDGNFVTTSGTDGSVTVNVRVTAWSIDSSGIVRDSYLGAYTPNGLGVTSGDDIGSDGKSGTSNTHTVDNQNRVDFLLFQFDKDVSLIEAKFTSFDLNGSKDSDATISYGKINLATLPIANSPNINDLARTAPGGLDSLFKGTVQSEDASGAGGTRGINPNGWVGNIWLISASQTGGTDKKTDAFKLSSLKFSAGGVPEPSTWAMMIAGFGLVGLGIRRRGKRRNIAIA